MNHYFWVKSQIHVHARLNKSLYLFSHWWPLQGHGKRCNYLLNDLQIIYNLFLSVNMTESTNKLLIISNFISTSNFNRRFVWSVSKQDLVCHIVMICWICYSLWEIAAGCLCFLERVWSKFNLSMILKVKRFSTVQTHIVTKIKVFKITVIVCDYA